MLHPQTLTLSPQRRQAVADALEHIRLAQTRLTVAERLLTAPACTPEPDEPDDLSVAVASIEQALSCVAVAFEEADRARFLP